MTRKTKVRSIKGEVLNKPKIACFFGFFSGLKDNIYVLFVI